MSACDEKDEVDFAMSNFDHVIDFGMDLALRAGGVFGRHAAMNFNGKVWFSDGQFHEEIWVHSHAQEIISAETLSDLMVAVNDKYGAE